MPPGVRVCPNVCLKWASVTHFYKSMSKRTESSGVGGILKCTICGDFFVKHVAATISCGACDGEVCPNSYLLCFRKIFSWLPESSTDSIPGVHRCASATATWRTTWPGPRGPTPHLSMWITNSSNPGLLRKSCQPSTIDGSWISPPPDSADRYTFLPIVLMNPIRIFFFPDSIQKKMYAFFQQSVPRHLNFFQEFFKMFLVFYYSATFGHLCHQFLTPFFVFRISDYCTTILYILIVTLFVSTLFIPPIPTIIPEHNLAWLYFPHPPRQTIPWIMVWSLSVRTARPGKKKLPPPAMPPTRAAARGRTQDAVDCATEAIAQFTAHTDVARFIKIEVHILLNQTVWWSSRPTLLCFQIRWHPTG